MPPHRLAVQLQTQLQVKSRQLDNVEGLLLKARQEAEDSKKQAATLSKVRRLRRLAGGGRRAAPTSPA